MSGKDVQDKLLCSHSHEGLPAVQTIAPVTPHLMSHRQNPLMRFGAPTQAWIVGTSGLHAGEDFRLATGTHLVGTSLFSAIGLTCPTVSLRHAEIFCNGQHIEIHHRKSRHGVSVNRQLVDSAILTDLDLIAVGKVEFIIRFAHTNAPKEKREAMLAWSLKFVPAMQQRPWTVGWLVSHPDNGLPVDYRLFFGNNHIGILPNRERILTLPSEVNSICEIYCEHEITRISSKVDDIKINGSPLVGEATLDDGDNLVLGLKKYRFRRL